LVRFGALLDGARALREQRQPAPRRWLRLIRLNLLTSSAGLRVLGAIGTGYQLIHPPAALVRKIGRWWPLLRVLNATAPSLRRPTSIQASDDRRQRAKSVDHASRALTDVGPDRTAESAAPERPVLFRGCVARISQQATEAAALHVLAQLGCAVEVVRRQTCCGAIHRHNGFPERAQERLETNRRAFGQRTLVGFASACIAELREHSDLQALEICRYLNGLHWPEWMRLAPLDATVAVHEPCSHRNLLRDRQSAYELLQRIPKLTLRALAGNELCCGAAGTYLTQHPETAITLAEPKIDALRTFRPQYLATTNTGCALHLQGQLRDAGLDTEVVHPVELIAKQLITKGLEPR
jgi:glycolate oxidase iron-sulfur subunit